MGGVNGSNGYRSWLERIIMGALAAALGAGAGFGGASAQDGVIRERVANTSRALERHEDVGHIAQREATVRILAQYESTQRDLERLNQKLDKLLAAMRRMED